MSSVGRPPRSLAPVTLHAGPVTLRFEPHTLWLRDLRVEGTEVLRALYPAVRDKAWSTAVPRVSWVRCRKGARSFSLLLRASYGGARPWLACDVAIDGRADGRIRLAFTGTAARAFTTNRTGLCVLHPAEVAGQPCAVEHIDGRRRLGRFPREISPRQPFLDLRALSHRVPGVGRVDVRLEGDTFEMEDQRNWTDASFKTYSRPLALPAPYTLKKGDRVSQVATVHVTPAGRRRSQPTPVPLRFDTRPRALPAVGLRLTAATVRGPTQAQRLSHLPLGHLRLELDLSAQTGLRPWDEALREVAAFPRETGLEVALHVRPGDPGLEALAQAAAGQAPGRAIRWIVLDREKGCTTAGVWTAVRRLWSRYRVPGELGGGARADFVQLNRERPFFPGMDFVSFALDPQVHAFDDASLLETLTMHPTVVRQAKRLSGDLPVVLSPVTLGLPRQPGRAPRGDPRQFTPFAAAWTLGCLAAVTSAGASVVTLHGTAGPAGVLPPRAGRPSPLLRLLEAWSTFPARSATALAPDARRSVCAVGLHGATSLRLLLANLRPTRQDAHLDGLPPVQPRTKVLSALGRASATVRRQRRSLVANLPGYAVVQLDFALS